MIAALVYPHQLFENHPALAGAKRVYLVEEPLFFTQYSFHRQKLILHRASMARFAETLDHARIVPVTKLKDTGSIADVLAVDGVTAVRYVDPCDDWLSSRLAAALKKSGIDATVLQDPHFLTPRHVIDDFVDGKKKLFFTEFYIQQRQRLNILVDDGPVGGKWSFDAENRRKLPKGYRAPKEPGTREHAAVKAARDSVRTDFPNALGNDEPFCYPTSHAEARTWLRHFIAERLEHFGDYEDAISTTHRVMNHSVLTPMLNIGLLSPQEVVDAVLAASAETPMNSLEGFIRQVIGWREFVRLVYLTRGRKQRTRNFWIFNKPIPKSFYDGSTGIEPVDHVIREVLKTGYCHHIERLMILGNFLMLCEVDPDAVYQWFMELFIDAYDWVMVPNVYGMSQHADGGGMTTKPYLSGSAYVLKMSDHKRGDWCEIWDALYWRFIDQQSAFFAKNPRMSMMVKMKDKLGDKLKTHRKVADAFLKRLHG